MRSSNFVKIAITGTEIQSVENSEAKKRFKVPFPARCSLKNLSSKSKKGLDIFGSKQNL